MKKSRNSTIDREKIDKINRNRSIKNEQLINFKLHQKGQVNQIDSVKKTNNNYSKPKESSKKSAKKKLEMDDEFEMGFSQDLDAQNNQRKNDGQEAISELDQINKLTTDFEQYKLDQKFKDQMKQRFNKNYEAPEFSPVAGLQQWNTFDPRKEHEKNMKEQITEKPVLETPQKQKTIKLDSILKSNTKLIKSNTIKRRNSNRCSVIISPTANDLEENQLEEDYFDEQKYFNLKDLAKKFKFDSLSLPSDDATTRPTSKLDFKSEKSTTRPGTSSRNERTNDVSNRLIHSFFGDDEIREVDERSNAQDLLVFPQVKKKTQDVKIDIDPIASTVLNIESINADSMVSDIAKSKDQFHALLKSNEFPKQDEMDQVSIYHSYNRLKLLQQQKKENLSMQRLSNLNKSRSIQRYNQRRPPKSTKINVGVQDSLILDECDNELKTDQTDYMKDLSYSNTQQVKIQQDSLRKQFNLAELADDEWDLAHLQDQIIHDGAERDIKTQKELKDFQEKFKQYKNEEMEKRIRFKPKTNYLKQNKLSKFNCNRQ